jgi:hypothetical protein
MRKTIYLAAGLLIAALGVAKAQFPGYWTANLPLIGASDGGITQGTRSGNTTKFATVSGTPGADDCAKFDASGNVVSNGADCAILIPNPASLSTQNQTLSGGANVTSSSLTAGNKTINCGLGPLQFTNNSGAFTITAPSSDGSCILLVTNVTGAGAISFSGFSTAPGASTALTTTVGSKFSIQIWRINGTAGFTVVAHQ